MHPILLQTSLFTIHTLWLLISIGIVIASYTAIRLAIRDGLKLQFLSQHLIRLVLAFIAGARIVSVALNYKNYFATLNLETLSSIFHIWDKGLNFHGGLIFALAYLFMACRHNEEQNFLKWLDVLAPAVIIALAFGHLGAFFEGINYGVGTSLPWGVNFESPWIKYTVPIHPTQIYAFLYSIATASGFIIINNFKTIRDKLIIGAVGLGSISLYSFLRFLEEFIRGDDVPLIGPIRISQLIALLVFLGTGIILFLMYNKNRLTTKKKKSNK